MLPNQDTVSSLANALGNLQRLRQFTGSSSRFWPATLQALVGVVGARLGILLHAETGNKPRWRRVSVEIAEKTTEAEAKEFLNSSDDLAEKSKQQGFAERVWPNVGGSGKEDHGIAVRLEEEASEGAWVGLFFLTGVSEPNAQESLRRLRLVTDIYRLQHHEARAETAALRFSSVLDLMVLLNAADRFLAAAMTLCNEVAARQKCERVSLGWIEKNYIRLKAMSHAERFDKKMEAVKTVETAMEEAFDQDETVLWPAPEAQQMVTRDHALHAESAGVKFLCSVPLRLEGKPVAALFCERNSEPFGEEEVGFLSLCCEMAVRRLADLKRIDRWFGARWAISVTERLGKLIGPEHTGAKLLGLIAAVALGVLLFGTMDYRVDAPFLLRTDDEAFLSAPFNGFIEDVKVDLGDDVKKGDPLLTLETHDLLLEEASALADQTRYLREAEKARAASKLADMRIAEAQAEQSRVRLELVRYRRNQATVVAPFNGAVIEGDFKKRLGAPLKQGDMLFRLGRTDHIYVEAKVDETDIHELRDNAAGEIAFASLPKQKFPIRIERVEPVAQPKEGSNAFVVRCKLQGDRQNWWRLGMTGVAKLDAGRRSLLWVVSHRTVDVLRMYFWW